MIDFTRSWWRCSHVKGDRVRVGVGQWVDLEHLHRVLLAKAQVEQTPLRGTTIHHSGGAK